ncbi:MAG: hypothetical protein NZ656_05175 [Nitrospinaceae bacterium]|nr:hypothetical protein [Nitrospinaceae bacterium]
MQQDANRDDTESTDNKESLYDTESFESTNDRRMQEESEVLEPPLASPRPRRTTAEDEVKQKVDAD